MAGVDPRDITASRVPGLIPTAGVPTYTQADITRLSRSGGINPAQLIDGNSRLVGAINTFDLRSDYVFTFNIGVSHYRRDNLVSVGKLDLRTFIALPLPNEVVDNLGVRYDTTELGVIVGRLFAGAGAPAGADQTAIPGSVGASIHQFAGQVGNALAGTAAAAAAAGASNIPFAAQAARGALASFGIAPNPFMIVIFRQPEYKIHNFTWGLTAKTPQESFKIAAMIAFLKNALSPGVDFTGSFFTYPEIFSLSFGYTGARSYGNIDLIKTTLFRFKPAVLTDLQVNYSPNGLPAMYAQTQAPQSVSISMKFMEIEYWLKGQFNEDLRTLNTVGSGLVPIAQAPITLNPLPSTASLSSIPADALGSTLGINPAPNGGGGP